MRFVTHITLVTLAVASGCTFDIADKSFKCDDEHACPPGQTCVAGLCENPNGDRCPPLDPPANGLMDPSSTTGEVGESVTYRCDTNYLIQGSASRSCQENLTWSGTDATCVDVCEASPPPRTCDAITPSPGCLDSVDGTDPLIYRIGNAFFPPHGEIAGFDLDCFATTDEDAYGCFRADLNGVDNAMIGVVQILAPLGIDLNQEFIQAIELDDFQASILVHGWSFQPDDACVVVEFAALDPLSGIAKSQPVPGVVEDGQLKVKFPEVPFPIPLGPGAPPTQKVMMTRLHGARFQGRIDETMIWEGSLGGSLLWEDGTGTDLYTVLAMMLEYNGATEFFETAVSVALDALDMHVPGTSATSCHCDALSLGIHVPEAYWTDSL